MNEETITKIIELTKSLAMDIAIGENALPADRFIAVYNDLAGAQESLILAKAKIMDKVFHE